MQGSVYSKQETIETTYAFQNGAEQLGVVGNTSRGEVGGKSERRRLYKKDPDVPRYLHRAVHDDTRTF